MVEEGADSKGSPSYLAIFLLYRTYHNYDQTIIYLMSPFSFYCKFGGDEDCVSFTAVIPVSSIEPCT